MTKRSLSTKKSNYNPNSKNNKFNYGIKLISEHYKLPAQKLMLHLMRHGYTLDQVAEIVGVSRDAVKQNWLKEIKEEEEAAMMGHPQDK